MSGRSVKLTALFLGRLNQYFVHILSPVTDNCPSWISGRRNESMWPDRVSNPGPLTYESGALPTALRGPAFQMGFTLKGKPKGANSFLWEFTTTGKSRETKLSELLPLKMYPCTLNIAVCTHHSPCASIVGWLTIADARFFWRYLAHFVM